MKITADRVHTQLNSILNSSRTLLQEVSAEFADRTLTALIGRNGTGKSTLLRAIAGLGPLAGGRIDLCGEPLDTLTPQRRRSRPGCPTGP